MLLEDLKSEIDSWSNVLVKNFDGRRMTVRMAELGITQDQLGGVIGCSQSDISKYKNGLALPPIGGAARMAKCLRLPFGDLVGEPELDRLEYLLRYYIQ
jgi:transcriptional regulator with XRE-family HTH domain